MSTQNSKSEFEKRLSSSWVGWTFGILIIAFIVSSTLYNGSSMFWLIFTSSLLVGFFIACLIVVCLKAKVEKNKNKEKREKDFTKALLDCAKAEKNIAVGESTLKTDENTLKEGEGMKKLEQLIGLSSVKEEVMSLVNYIHIQRLRLEKGMKVPDISYHTIFTGNPGTGKTTVARILASIYRDLGILKKGHLVETDRSGLVAEYVGQTAVKTNRIIDSALDGVLFIDEAYSLVSSSDNDYGKEAIATLLKRMEDDRGRLIVVLAGYTDEMKDFIDSNPGLESRFNRYIEFQDYMEDELLQIFYNNLKKYEYTITDGAVDKLKQLIAEAVLTKDRNFGNGRWVRNLFEKTLEDQATRLATGVNLSKEDLATITGNDIDLPER